MMAMAVEMDPQRSPSALVASAFISLARSLIAAFSSAEKPLLAFADVLVAFLSSSPTVKSPLWCLAHGRRQIVAVKDGRGGPLYPSYQNISRN